MGTAASGLYPIFLVVLIWMKDRIGNASELIYSKKISSARLVVSRYLASVTMILLPVLLLSFESLVPLIALGAKKGISVDYFAYIKYILWWLLPEVMAVSAIGIFFTLLTDSPIAIAIQFLWWMVDKGVTGLSGDTGATTLMIRHNTLRGYEVKWDSHKLSYSNPPEQIVPADLHIKTLISLGNQIKSKIFRKHSPENL